MNNNVSFRFRLKHVFFHSRSARFYSARRVGHGLDPSMDWIGLEWVWWLQSSVFSFIYILY